MCKKEDKLIEQYRALTLDVDQKKRELFYKIQEAHQDIVADNIVKSSNICIVLSCPGELELLEGKPAVGQTGINLFTILKKVSERRGNDFNDFIVVDDKEMHDQISIINAYDRVFFRLVNSAEPNDNLITAADNIQRLDERINSIKDLKYLIVCGNKAELAISNSQSKPHGLHIAIVPHIGNVGIRNEYPISYKCEDGRTIGDLRQDERDEMRYALIANDILNQFGRNLNKQIT